MLGPAPLSSAREHSQHQGRAFPQAAFGFFCLLSFVNLAFFSLAEYLAVSIYLFPSLIFFFLNYSASSSFSLQDSSVSKSSRATARAACAKYTVGISASTRGSEPRLPEPIPGPGFWRVLGQAGPLGLRGSLRSWWTKALSLAQLCLSCPRTQLRERQTVVAPVQLSLLPHPGLASARENLVELNLAALNLTQLCKRWPLLGWPFGCLEWLWGQGCTEP